MSYDFEEGRKYKFQDLPANEQQEAVRQFKYDLGLDPRDFDYQFIFVPFETLKAAMLKKHFSKSLEGLWAIMEDAGELEKIDFLVDSIQNEGLHSVPIGAEGWHRALAALRSGMDLPYLRAIPGERAKAMVEQLEGWKMREIIPSQNLD